MKILYCNIALRARSGTEVVTIDTALGLNRRGIEVCVYAPLLGDTSRALSDQGILVTSDLGALPWRPDAVHSNHIGESLEAAIRFPDTPQIFLCHDADAWHSTPPRLSLIKRWLAVDEVCAERIRRNVQDAPGIRWMPNAVDLGTHVLRSELPPRPARGLLLTKNTGYFDEIASACTSAGIELDRLGSGLDLVVDDLPMRLQDYDIVFATARMAIESMACGCAVVAVDARGLAGLVTTENVEAWRRHNFGRSLLTRAVTAEALGREIANYNAADARAVSSYVREHASLERYLDGLIEVYGDAIGDFTGAPVDPRLTLQQVGAAFHSLLPDDANASLYDAIHDQIDGAERDRVHIDQLHFAAAETAGLQDQMQNKLDQTRMSLDQTQISLDKTEMRLAEAVRQLDLRRKPLKFLIQFLRWMASPSSKR